MKKKYDEGSKKENEKKYSQKNTSNNTPYLKAGLHSNTFISEDDLMNFLSGSCTVKINQLLKYL